MLYKTIYCEIHWFVFIDYVINHIIVFRIIKYKFLRVDKYVFIHLKNIITFAIILSLPFEYTESDFPAADISVWKKSCYFSKSV